MRPGPCPATTSIGFSNSLAINPKTENITNPARKLVDKLIKEVAIASLK